MLRQLEGGVRAIVVRGRREVIIVAFAGLDS